MVHKTKCPCFDGDSVPAVYKVVSEGLPGTLEYRVRVVDSDGCQISPWHSVPLCAGEGLVNFVCEIPKLTRAKFEVSTKDEGNPIKQDSKKGKPRFYGIDMKWNYGMLPQTWEDPEHPSDDCGGLLGDADPVDVVEVGEGTASTGAVYPVKPIAALAMVDDGELDWKIIAISTADPRCKLVNSLADMEVHFPGVVSEVREWFRVYKTFEDKPLNKFALDERAIDRDLTMSVISFTHELWKALVLKASQQTDSVKYAVEVQAAESACFEKIAGTAMKADVILSKKGREGTLDYRVHFRDLESRTISPWHSIPLYAEKKGFVNFVCEIPRGTRAKFEVCTKEEGNPIKQDSKKGKPRFYGIDMKWNYGMLPQTWEDPRHHNEECGGYFGDADPVDIVEVSSHMAVTGGVYKVKPVAALAMIDEGELDWKVIAIASSDPRSELVNSVADMEKYFPGIISEIREWFRTYKTFEGKPLNKFAFDDQAVDIDYTMRIISQTHMFWRLLVEESHANAKGLEYAVGDVPIPSSAVAAAAPKAVSLASPHGKSEVEKEASRKAVAVAVSAL